MRDQEIQRRIASFSTWHYQFDLDGHLTPIRERARINRHNQRKRYFFDPLVQLHGGSLEGKRVLDLGCNAGFWSLLAAQAGCDYVLGIDGRQMHVDQANFVFEVNGIQKERYGFVAADIFETDLTQFGDFDIVLCLGLMYHVSKHVEIMEKISEVSRDILLIDTSLSTETGSFLKLRHDRSRDPRSAVDRTLVMAPTWEAMRDLITEFGYSMAVLKPRFDDYEGAKDYQNRRRAFVCTRQTEVSRIARLAEIESEPPISASSGRPRQRRGDSPSTRSGARPSRKDLLHQTQQISAALSELFASRRWKIARALSRVARRVFRRSQDATAEDRLLEISSELRDQPEKRGRQGSRRRWPRKE